jgi:hypothetical protein
MPFGGPARGKEADNTGEHHARREAVATARTSKPVEEADAMQRAVEGRRARR